MADVTGEDAVEFVRDSITPESFNGRWQVWTGGTYHGIVRKGEPVYAGKPWGWEGKGRRCEAGYGTRSEAARALVAAKPLREWRAEHFGGT